MLSQIDAECTVTQAENCCIGPVNQQTPLPLTEEHHHVSEVHAT